MKKTIKIAIVFIVIVVILVMANFLHNISIITKVKQIGAENTKKYAQIELITNLNGEISSGIIDNNYGILPEEIPIINKIFDVITIEDNCYKITVGDITFFNNKDTGLIEKSTSKMMKSTTIHNYILEENE